MSGLEHTIGGLLHRAYANLAMADAAVSEGAEAYGRTHYMIRAKLFKGLQDGRFQVGSFAKEELLKMRLPRACCYCGSLERLTLEHLVPRRLGGSHSGDNLVWACRHCNSSKGGLDLLVWMEKRGVFPPLYIFRRYLKLALAYGEDNDLMDQPVTLAEASAQLPFELSRIPDRFPPTSDLVLWVAPRMPSEEARASPERSMHHDV